MSTGGKNPVLQVWQVKAAQVGPEGVKWTDFVLAENSTTEAVKSSMEDVTQSKLSDEKLKDSSLPAPQPNQNPTPEHLTLISGDPDYLNSVRRTNGVIGADGHVICNRTLTFQIGILKPRPEETQVSYWDFINVSPPANPVQGWQVVAERTEC